MKWSLSGQTICQVTATDEVEISIVYSCLSAGVIAAWRLMSMDGAGLFGNVDFR